MLSTSGPGDGLQYLKKAWPILTAQRDAVQAQDSLRLLGS